MVQRPLSIRFETTDTSGLESMLESVVRFASTIRSPAAFARPALYSTGLDSLLGTNENAHSFGSITIELILINNSFGATINYIKIAHCRSLGRSATLRAPYIRR